MTGKPPQDAQRRLQSDIDFPAFIFSSRYLPVIELIVQEKRPTQIAGELKITPQNLNHRLNRLEKAGIITQGIKSSYREWLLNPEAERELKEKITEFKAKKRISIVNLNLHHCSVLWPIERDAGVLLKHRRKRWRSELTEETVEFNSLFFRAEKTPKNFIIRFPGDFGISYAGFADGAVKTVKFNCLQLAGAAKNKALKRFGNMLVLGSPQVRGHYAKKDALAGKLTRRGITFTLRNDKTWTGIDKSPHFFPRGEIETNDEEAAQGMLEMLRDWPRVKRKLGL